MPRLLRTALLLLALTGCTAEPACVDGLARRCVTNSDCDTGDGCREIVGRGFFCAPPDKSGFRVTGSLLQTAVPIAEGRTDSGLVVRGGGFRTLPRAQGRTDSNYIVVEGDLKMIPRAWHTGALVLGAAALASSVTYVVAARAVGIPDGDENPALVYSGVLLKDGLPVVDAVEIEVGLWDDVTRGEPDLLLCTTGEGVTVQPDASGAFSIPLPTLVGEEDKDCLAALAAENNVYVQLEVDKEVVKYELNGKEFQRLPVAAVPFAADAKRAQFAAGGPENLTIEERLAALEAAVAADAGQ